VLQLRLLSESVSPSFARFYSLTMSQELRYSKEFTQFVDASPSAFHAVDSVVSMLKASQFARLSESDASFGASIKPGGRYYFTRNQSTVFAFAVGMKYKPGNGFSIVAAHTDSPCLKVKPVSVKSKVGYQEVGVEVYGGGLWYTWFDRDLSVAGRAIVAEGNTFVSRLVRISRPILRIPSLAIHLNREVNEKGFDFNKENHLLPILATTIKAALQPKSQDSEKKEEDRHNSLLVKMIADELQTKESSIRDFELSLYDTQPAVIGGALNEFIFSARLDNLLMSYCAIRSLLASLETPDALENESNIRLVSLFDNEEVGSASNHGAASNMMIAALSRIIGDNSLLDQAVARSFLISADMAHAVHPNYAEKHEENLRPAMHKGLTVKYNANQRYATSSVTAFIIRDLAHKYNIPLQDFAVRNDSACGSTIGPILASNCGMRTVDVGIPQLSMHSIREMCGTADLVHSIHLIQAFFSEFPTLDQRLVVD